MKWKPEDMAGEIEGGGQYAGKVHEAEERFARDSNGEPDKDRPYINLKLHVQGKTFYDIISPRYPPKLAHFCRSAGLLDKYEMMSLEASDCVGKTVQVILTQEQNEKGYFEIHDYTWGGRDGEQEKKRKPKLEGVNPKGAKQAAKVRPQDDVPF